MPLKWSKKSSSSLSFHCFSFSHSQLLLYCFNGLTKNLEVDDGIWLGSAIDETQVATLVPVVDRREAEGEHGLVLNHDPALGLERGGALVLEVLEQDMFVFWVGGTLLVAALAHTRPLQLHDEGVSGQAGTTD